MKIELKKLKILKSASQETLCFEAQLYIGNVNFGVVGNSGQGGENFYTNDLAEKMLSDYAKTLPKFTIDGFVDDSGKLIEMERDADILIEKAIQDFQNKKMCARQTLFRKPNEKYDDGVYHSIVEKFTLEVKADLIKRYGKNVFILNEHLNDFSNTDDPKNSDKQQSEPATFDCK